MYSLCKHKPGGCVHCGYYKEELYCGIGLKVIDKTTGKNKWINKIEEMKHCPHKEDKKELIK